MKPFFLIRILHVLIGLFFILCLAYVYFSLFYGSIHMLTYWALIAIYAEGVLLALNKGRCPLTNLQKRLGDDKGFFDLFLPAGFLPFVIPVFTLLTLIATVLVFFEQD